MHIIHHGGSQGVTGSCHELVIDEHNSILIDCGLFQGSEAGNNLAHRPEIDFPLDRVKGLILTHVHLDHVGRLPYLFAAGFTGPIYCSHPSARLLPLVVEDAIKVGFTSDTRLIKQFVTLVNDHLIPLAYHKRMEIALTGADKLAIRLNRAGHIFGSAFVQCRVTEAGRRTDIIFSGDLGAPYTPLLPAPDQPYGCDLLVLESTYGDRLHGPRRDRRRRLQAIIEGALANGGTILIPAFSIGRTQEILYELEGILAEQQQKGNETWRRLPIFLDSPLADKVTKVYRELSPWWDKEAHARLRRGRQPLAFSQLQHIEDHAAHLANVDNLRNGGQPAIVIAAGGMCTGGRIVNYLEAMLPSTNNDVLFVGYQAAGTPGRDIQQYGPTGGYVMLNGRRITIRAKIHSLAGYSAHADQGNLVNFVKRMRKKPAEIILVHGEADAKQSLKSRLAEVVNSKVRIPA
ncbi:MAG: MBL fold metallo-hydrolase [Desulfobulbaceae bacterium]|nr:MBL fold metallo-hydrolase [Desulfobulbaceae bacterium]